MGFRALVSLPAPRTVPEWDGNFPTEVLTVISFRIYLRPIWLPSAKQVTGVAYGNDVIATGRVAIGSYTDVGGLASAWIGDHVIPTATMNVADSNYEVLATLPWTIPQGRSWLFMQMEVGGDQGNGYDFLGLADRTPPNVFQYNDPGSFIRPTSITPILFPEAALNLPVSYNVLLA